MDPCDEPAANTEDAAKIREVEAQKIFERLQETSSGYQQILYLQMLKLTSARVEELVVQALEAHCQQQDPLSGSPPPTNPKPNKPRP